MWRRERLGRPLFMPFHTRADPVKSIQLSSPSSRDDGGCEVWNVEEPTTPTTPSTPTPLLRKVLQKQHRALKRPTFQYTEKTPKPDSRPSDVQSKTASKMDADSPSDAPQAA